jgi:enoyl-CoA hydratase/carnithine racemase
MELILLADIVDAQEALRIGLVNRVVPAEQRVAAFLEKRPPRFTGRTRA